LFLNGTPVENLLRPVTQLSFVNPVSRVLSFFTKDFAQLWEILNDMQKDEQFKVFISPLSFPARRGLLCRLSPLLNHRYCVRTTIRQRFMKEKSAVQGKAILQEM
jgi:hypothetical protein